MARTVLDEIRQAVRARVELNVPMADHTTLRVGGAADVVVYPEDRDALARLLALLAAREVPWIVLGNGSNLVVRDGGIRGAVVSLCDGFDALEDRGEDEGGRRLVRVEAGVGIRRLVRWSVDQGVGGFEFLVGIPGSVGGALAMNAGAWEAQIGDRVEELEVLLPGEGLRLLARDELAFRYRGVDLPEGAAVVGVILAGQPSDPEHVKARAKELYQRRRTSQPVGRPSAGSVFRNPPSGPPAGWLIEDCGLKGVRVGDAEVSQVHANFIVNAGRAKASHVVSLIGMIQERVYVNHKVKLETEVRIVGDWEKGKLRIQE